MKNSNPDHVIGIPAASVSFAAGELRPDPAYGSSKSRHDRKDSVIHWMSRLSRKADRYVQGIREHVSSGSKMSKTVKAKLSLTARIINAGGVERVFGQVFAVEEGEKLLKAFQCYLWTTVGPIAGILFISTKQIKFHSDRSLQLTSPKGDSARVPYKVLIPLRSIRQVVPFSRRNLDKQSQKHIQIVTLDDFEFWFMGFVSYKKSFMYLKKAITESQ